MIVPRVLVIAKVGQATTRPKTQLVCNWSSTNFMSTAMLPSPGQSSVVGSLIENSSPSGSSEHHDLNYQSVRSLLSRMVTYHRGPDTRAEAMTCEVDRPGV